MKKPDEDCFTALKMKPARVCASVAAFLSAVDLPEPSRSPPGGFLFLPTRSAALRAPFSPRCHGGLGPSMGGTRQPPPEPPDEAACRTNTGSTDGLGYPLPSDSQ